MKMLAKLKAGELTALVWQHDVALVVEVQRLVPLLTLEELVPDFLHLHGGVQVFVEVNLVFVDLVLGVFLVTFQSELLLDVAGFVGESELVAVAREAGERLELIALEVVAGVLVEVEEESGLDSIRFDIIRGERVKHFRATE